MTACSHPRMQSTARIDFCPDCKYEFYYGDAHATGRDRESRLINKGRDAGQPPDDAYLRELYAEDEENTYS